MLFLPLSPTRHQACAFAVIDPEDHHPQMLARHLEVGGGLNNPPDYSSLPFHGPSCFSD
jgi:hypothetical protein